MEPPYCSDDTFMRQNSACAVYHRDGTADAKDRKHIHLDAVLVIII